MKHFNMLIIAKTVFFLAFSVLSMNLENESVKEGDIACAEIEKSICDEIYKQHLDIAEFLVYKYKSTCPEEFKKRVGVFTELLKFIIEYKNIRHPDNGTDK